MSRIQFLVIVDSIQSVTADTRVKMDGVPGVSQSAANPKSAIPTA